MVPLLARETLIAQSVARCHTRGFLSAEACLQTHPVRNEEAADAHLPCSAVSGSVLPVPLPSQGNLLFPDVQGLQSLLHGKYSVRDS